MGKRMSFTKKHWINTLYNLFMEITHDNGGDCQAAFEEVTEGQTRSVKEALKADLYTAGYTNIK